MVMDPDAPKPRPERDQTDESLRTERKNTDREAAEKRTRTEQTADGIVERANQAFEIFEDDRIIRGIHNGGVMQSE